MGSSSTESEYVTRLYTLIVSAWVRFSVSVSFSFSLSCVTPSDILYLFVYAIFKDGLAKLRLGV